MNYDLHGTLATKVKCTFGAHQKRTLDLVYMLSTATYELVVNSVVSMDNVREG